MLASSSPSYGDISDWEPHWKTASTETLVQTRFKSFPEDFQVSESLNFELLGAGEHRYFYIQKRNQNTQSIAERIADKAQCRAVDVGYAGMKDRRALTCQWFSVQLPPNQEFDVRLLESKDIRVLKEQRHPKKLRRGEILFNHFRIILRDLELPEETLDLRLREISTRGFPNYFGPQRFGRSGDNLDNAVKMFKRQLTVRQKHIRGLYLSTARSFLFNEYLSYRLKNNLWQVAVPGDLAIMDGKVLDNPSIGEVQGNEGARGADSAFLSGPLFGDGPPQVGEQSLKIEAEISAEHPDIIEGLRAARIDPARRALCVVPQNMEWEMSGSHLELSFGLPTGSYATSLLRECFILV